MLVIRKEQWEAMHEARWDAFYRKLLHDARARHPDTYADSIDDAVLELIAWAANKARAYGLLTREHVTRFVHFVLQYGRDYETQPDLAWAVKILNDPTLVGAEKLDRLDEQSPGV